MQTVLKKELPKCDLCDEAAQYDSNTKLGRHGFLCEYHFKKLGIPPSTRLKKLEKKEVEKPEKIKSVTVPLTLSVARVECPYCGTQRRVEPDANYQVECFGCGNEYRIRSMI